MLPLVRKVHSCMSLSVCDLLICPVLAVSAYLAPPVAAVYLLAVLWPRSNELGAFSALMFGLLLGITRLILSVIYSDPICGELDTRPLIVGKLHYMYFGFGSFASTLLIMVVVSFIGKKPHAVQISRLTYFTAWDLLHERAEQPEQKYTNAVNGGPLGSEGTGTIVQYSTNEDTFGKAIWMQPCADNKAELNELVSCASFVALKLARMLMLFYFLSLTHNPSGFFFYSGNILPHFAFNSIDFSRVKNG
ncbi:unnamed protein product [Dicrocoelium dendriticum]|nr:unnamed protein product [Dicrocoelium dendriticum]